MTVDGRPGVRFAAPDDEQGSGRRPRVMTRVATA